MPFIFFDYFLEFSEVIYQYYMYLQRTTSFRVQLFPTVYLLLFFSSYEVQDLLVVTGKTILRKKTNKLFHLLLLVLSVAFGFIFHVRKPNVIVVFFALAGNPTGLELRHCTVGWIAKYSYAYMNTEKNIFKLLRTMSFD